LNKTNVIVFDFKELDLSEGLAVAENSKFRTLEQNSWSCVRLPFHLNRLCLSSRCRYWFKGDEEGSVPTNSTEFAELSDTRPHAIANKMPSRTRLHRKSFSEGAFREAYMAKAISGLPKGDYVLKKYKEEHKKL